MVRLALGIALSSSIIVVAAGAGAGAYAAPPSGWPGEEMPLPLAVRTPQDLAVKAAAERQYLIFNLLAGGKVAFDSGDFATAAAKWEALLRLPGLAEDIDRAIRPLAEEARGRAGGSPSSGLPPATAARPPATTGAQPHVSGPPEAGERDAVRPVAGVTVSGTVSGGGTLGPGGTVLSLHRVNGETPRPAAARGKVVTQRNKTFIPRVLAVPVGSKVDFRNEDDIFHNVFSLARPNDFDTGLYRQGTSYAKTFRKAGLVQLLCNIHASMIGYVYVVDTPWYGQADAGGGFTIKNVPPGEYELAAWHEASSQPGKQRVTVGPAGVRGLSVKVAGDKRAPQFVPDKSGKPRQTHLTY
jgi:plastocyanin